MSVSFSELTGDVPSTVPECMVSNIMYNSDKSSTVANLSINPCHPVRPFVGLIVELDVVLEPLEPFRRPLLPR